MAPSCGLGGLDQIKRLGVGKAIIHLLLLPDFPRCEQAASSSRYCNFPAGMICTLLTVSQTNHSLKLLLLWHLVMAMGENNKHRHWSATAINR